jgi:HTH-type transcriptional repressor of NAD biosynthesis genes
MSKTIVLGKFYPLHLGHISLIKFAERMSPNLVILVDNHLSYTMSLSDRVAIVKKTFPHLEVRGINESTYQEPTEHDDFWNYWKNILNKYVPEGIDEIIGSMDYVKELAGRIDCRYTIIDKERNGINISATKIRNNLSENWIFLAPESKAYFTKSVALVGAESCGKSTLTKKLAEYFNTTFVPEYGRTFVEAHGQDFNSNDLVHIAKTHSIHADVLKTESNQLFFYDTEAIVTKYWHKFFFNHDRAEIDDVINQQKIELFILVPVQDSWVEDPVRYHEEKEARLKFYNEIKSELINRNQKFVEIQAKDWDSMFTEIVNTIKGIL